MINVLLACNAGVSTAMMEKKIAEEAKRRNIELIVNAASVSRIESFVKDNDIIVLGPQVRFASKKIEKEYPDIPVYVIEMADFGMMRADNVLDNILRVLSK
ncbi:PTS system cellobiose-specific IIB component [Breznakia blatticola]|uniref:PTS system cellobiose-specific IIB component n=1 Tax=Breznakia blatticola TaxID=1754012 RepID=A0A4R8AC70_9FIRM|nr:PTS sugar transporter subunit IIB [Breznakia blatticola]TDW26100.1 PTS system cellobiose-specific IIB component [Breznakia blatticola]